MTHSASTPLDAVIIGGGQSALAVAYFLRRTQLSFVILDAEEAPGGAWRHGWNSLRLFSPATWSSEVSKVAETTWVTPTEPMFLPDDVDGRVLFERATQRLKAQQEGRVIDHPVGGLGDIVMVPPVIEARGREALKSVRPFERFTRAGVRWADGSESAVDVVIWCTGFRPALQHLEALGVINTEGRVEVEGTHSIQEPRLWLVGYGEWTGSASATLIGVTRTARSTVNEIAACLDDSSMTCAPKPQE